VIAVQDQGTNKMSFFTQANLLHQSNQSH
jgi:hypothetical protein